MTLHKWSFALGGLLVWAAHFFLLYGFASIWPDSSLAHTLSIVATMPALAADALLLWVAAARRSRPDADRFDRWLLDLRALGAALSFVAVVWQVLPALTL